MATRRFVLKAGFSSAAAIIWAMPQVLTNPAAAASRGPVTHTVAEWRKILTASQFAVLRQDATERPFSSKLLHETRTGTFNCAGCSLQVFQSSAKFDSGTGWPSFWQPISNAVVTKTDGSFGMDRTAVSCRRCSGHLGHVFKDGPKPTGLRYCMNGVALNFSVKGA
jgi:peptide-methionine (R)-S-oxide reductase